MNKIPQSDPQNLERANFKAKDRLAQLSDSALREVCDLLDDIMVTYTSEQCIAEAELYQSMLIETVMEEERRREHRA